mgnify:CR=1 FL=1
MDILFEKGIPGFESYKHFTINKVEENEKFYMINSKEDSNIGFVSVSPFEIKNNYEIDLNDEFTKVLNIESPEDRKNIKGKYSKLKSTYNNKYKK